MIILVASEYREADELKDWAANSRSMFSFTDSLGCAALPPISNTDDHGFGGDLSCLDETLWACSTFCHRTG